MEDGIMKKVKLGIVGLGRLGKKHAEDIAFRIPNAELTAVCSIIKNEVDEVLSNWGIKYGYTDYYEMLKNKELDGIVIASSTTEHCRHIEASLDAGFHVFCEKPLGVTIDECKSAEKASERNPGKVLFLGFMNRYDKPYMYVKKKIEEGFIGKPILIRCYRLDPKKYVQSSIEFSGKSGGLFFDVAIHDIDIARWLLGVEPRSIFSMGGCFLHDEFKKYNDIDNGTISMQFENDTMGYFYVGRTCVEGYHIETEIIGTEGSLKVGALNESNQVTVFNEFGAIKEFNGWFIERYEQAFLNEKQEFVNCILENRKPGVSVYDGTKATEIVFAAKDSLLNNKLVYLKDYKK
jgi:myo-inositol 2-dehydrogenase/D-chiro-inositol 1-dehydrogenase